MSTLTTVNPASGKKIETYKLHSNEQVGQFITDAHEAFQHLKTTDFSQRAEWMYKAAAVLESNKDKYAKAITDEMGKNFTSAKTEIEKCAWVCKYYAENAVEFLQDELIDTDASKSYISYQPLGVILAVMPWNYPFWQVFRFAAPALMAGNTAVLKHASNVPQSALFIEEVFQNAGFPTNCFKTLLVSSNQVSAILENPLVKAATLTGSGPAGQAVAASSGKNIKKTVLELGGNDPYLVLEDADLELAATQCAQSRLLNAGQSCIGAKRFIVVDTIYEEFMTKFTSKMEQTQMGSPYDENKLGPLARIDLRNEVHEQVLKSINSGAILTLGGEIPEMEGAYYPPTILENVKPGMPAYEEEIFGPVASVIRVSSETEAIRIANDTIFGLGACVFTKDVKRGENIAKNHLNAGSCFVNQFVKSDPRLPFGGINQSGYGRELSYYGIRKFTNIKTVYIK